jgi:hypothetical protein
MKNIIIFILTAALIGCSGSSLDRGAPGFAESKIAASPDYLEADATSVSAEVGTAAPAPEPSDLQVPAPPTKKVIKTGNLQIEVKNLKNARTEADSLVRKFNAEILNETETNDYYRVENSLTISVLPENFEALVKALEGLAINVASKNINAQDVTKQFVDLETRLQAKRDVIARFREILKSAKTVKDILEVEGQLRVVIEEVEAIEAQLKYLREQVQRSTLHLSMFQTFEHPSTDKRSFLDRLGKSFASGWQVFLEIILGIARLWPVILILAGAAWLLVRYLRSRRKS